MLILFSFNFILIFISMMVSVAFYTILERKILGYIQIRKGPNKVGLLGILQPFSDAIKLFNKNLTISENSNLMLIYLTPALSLFIIMMLIPILNFNYSSLWDNKHNILLFFILSSFSVYFILLIGWSSNSKYSSMGAMRSVAQMISYEISFFMIILFISILSYSYSFTEISNSQYFFFFFWGNSMLFLMWMMTCLAETNRSPFDFAEGESELVSGFNIDYMGGWFALIFLSEYLSMILLMIISMFMFFNSMLNYSSLMILLLMTIIFLWVRGTLPRFRYDFLMNLSWKIFLPISLLIIPISISTMFMSM